jgi:putative tryptophan/tyrosine transport system substrate-binding protein
MNRREFITLLGGATAWPLVARAQAERMRRIGVLMRFAESDPEQRARTAAFLKRLQELGWTDGRNIRIDYRHSEGETDRMSAHAKELVALAPDLILVQSNGALAALREATSRVSIVFVQVSDPVGGGFVKSLARPGGNLTGFTNFEPEMGGKWIEALKEAANGVTRVAVLFNSAEMPANAAHAAFLRAAQRAAPAFGTTVTAGGVHDVAEIERFVAAFAAEPNGGLIVLPHPLHNVNRDRIIALAARHRLPAVYPFRFFVTAGGLISYGIDQVDQWRRAAAYVDRILQGEKPANLPVQQPIKYELVINLKTAKALGIEVPPMLLARADEVIE